jgi:flagellar protein FliS
MNGTQYFANRYQEMDVNTAKPLQLVVMLYDAAVRSIEAAHGHMQRNDISGRTREINKCNAIISELQSSLNLKEGGEIASSLNRLYDYMKRTLFKAGVEQDPALLVEVEGLLKSLGSSWRQIAAGNAVQPVPVPVRKAAPIPSNVDLAGAAAASAATAATEAAYSKSFSISA